MRPYPLELLLRRVATEWDTRGRVFDLPARRFAPGDPTVDLHVPFATRRASSPLGPAAGPHTQLAQNYVLAWLAGARVFECKTVQVRDDLDIPRPCIDMETVGYNVEWSQELRIEESLEEYVKAWMLLEILGRWQPLAEVIGPVGTHVFDVSVGYDLDGIRSTPVTGFLRGMRDAGAIVDHLREQLPAPFEEFRDHPFDPEVATTATLSTFHGCPPEEIEQIVRFLIDEHDLDVVVKLNPTLLGLEQVDRLLHDRLGYDDVRLEEEAFAADLAFPRAVDLVARLDDHARSRGHRFGIKLTNTLVVRNDGDRLPGDVRYLSGPPLHVLAVALLDRLVEALPGRLALGDGTGTVGVSWSAGVDTTNVVDTAALGVRPVTMSSNLLKPGGYGHLATMHERLRSAVVADGHDRLDAWVAHRHAVARGLGYRDAVAAYAARLEAAPEVEHYAASRVGSPRHQLERELERWGCVSCDLCVVVCPNDAMLRVPTPPAFAEAHPDRWQYLCLADLCNACGNCTTFCPEVGAPFERKPRLFLDREAYADDDGPAFLVGWEGELGLREVSPSLEPDVPVLEALLDPGTGVPLGTPSRPPTSGVR